MKTYPIRAALAALVPAPLKGPMKRFFGTLISSGGPRRHVGDPSAQDLDLYWDAEFGEVLDTWGAGTTWREIPLLLANCRGPVLDIACGTGKTMEILQCLPALELHGCDISDFLIQKALARGLSKARLQVCDATRTSYADNSFHFAYSIGSLEHFTGDGIGQFVHECHRITRFTSFHMLPVARSGQNEGWLKTKQSFFNNSVAWWLEQFHKAYRTVHALDSSWNDEISVGKWFVCIKEEQQT